MCPEHAVSFIVTQWTQQERKRKLQAEVTLHVTNSPYTHFYNLHARPHEADVYLTHFKLVSPSHH
jgi:hypothetical protein